MSTSSEDRDRHVVPRLRTFSLASRIGELSSLTPHKENPFHKQLISAAIEDFEVSPSISVAADLLSVAATLGHLDAARDAAHLILSADGSPIAARKLAELCVGNISSESNESTPNANLTAFVREDLFSQIHATRVRLQRYPSDAILWTNLAALYTYLGQVKQAKRSLQIAYSLAPQNRYVVRSISRILLHQGEGDLAHRILRNADGILSDPWILSAEIATAGTLGRTSGFLKNGQRLIQKDKFLPFDSSELASAVGTIFACNGNQHHAKRMIRQSLINPSENSVAQAAWLARTFPGLPELSKPATASYEANAWLTRQRGELRRCLLQSEHWQKDQPFSARPAEMGSFMASRIERHEDSVRIAEQGLLSNPNNFTLRNNLAFSYGNLNLIDKAAKILRDVDVSTLSPIEKIVFTATSGLLAFRAGNVAGGRALYRKSVTHAKARNDNRAAVAMIYQAMEELRLGTSEAPVFKKNALDQGRRELTAPEDTALIEQLEAAGKSKNSVFDA
jgi:tetratricopeptide (TPR) repeat protein